ARSISLVVSRRDPRRARARPGVAPAPWISTGACRNPQVESPCRDGWREVVRRDPMHLAIQPTIEPMEARSVDAPPRGDDWVYEPKWDGFRCLAFRDGDDVYLQSKSGRPLARYFPDVVELLRGGRARKFVLDGEIVIPVEKVFSFDELLMRIHPAASRVQ